MRRLLTAIFTVTIFCWVGLAQAKGDSHFAQKRRQAHGRTYLAKANKKSVKVIPRQKAVKKAKGKHKGKVLSVKLKKPKKGEPYYRVKVLEKGKVRVIRIKAKDK